MVQFIQGRDITLAQLIDQFGLQRADNEQFFSEWQQDLPELSDLEKQSLNEVKAEYLHLSRYQILEPVVKMVVLSPLLRLAGFYQPPFTLRQKKRSEFLLKMKAQLLEDVLISWCFILHFGFSLLRQNEQNIL